MLKAKKRFGQNFLNNDGIINEIVGLLNLSASDQVLEIGPGTGALTEQLVKAVDKLIAVEIDRDLIPSLSNKFKNEINSGNFELLNQDILTIDLQNIFTENKYKVIGNLPYNISTPILFKILANMNKIDSAYFMLQKEVADRLCASPNSKQYGRLTIMAKYYAEVIPVLDVSPENFNPKPKVNSSIVKITPKPYLDIDISSQSKLFDNLGVVTQTAFNMRRKTISNALKSIIDISEIEKLGLNPKLRPENLSLQDYILLAKNI